MGGGEESWIEGEGEGLEGDDDLEDDMVKLHFELMMRFGEKLFSFFPHHLHIFIINH